jgi:hypothetical protein
MQSMQYLILTLLLILMLPMIQTIYGQVITEEIDQIFENLTSNLMGNKDTSNSNS